MEQMLQDYINSIHLMFKLSEFDKDIRLEYDKDMDIYRVMLKTDRNTYSGIFWFYVRDDQIILRIVFDDSIIRQIIKASIYNSDDEFESDISYDLIDAKFSTFDDFKSFLDRHIWINTLKS